MLLNALPLWAVLSTTAAAQELPAEEAEAKPVVRTYALTVGLETGRFDGVPEARPLPSRGPQLVFEFLTVPRPDLVLRIGATLPRRTPKTYQGTVGLDYVIHGDPFQRVPQRWVAAVLGIGSPRLREGPHPVVVAWGDALGLCGYR